MSGRNGGTTMSAGSLAPSWARNWLDSWVVMELKTAKNGAPSGRLLQWAVELLRSHVAATSMGAL